MAIEHCFNAIIFFEFECFYFLSHLVSCPHLMPDGFIRFLWVIFPFFIFRAEDGIRYCHVTGVQTCALPISQRLEPGANIAQLLDALELTGKRVAVERNG